MTEFLLTNATLMACASFVFAHKILPEFSCKVGSFLCFNTVRFFSSPALFLSYSEPGNINYSYSGEKSIFSLRDNLRFNGCFKRRKISPVLVHQSRVVKLIRENEWDLFFAGSGGDKSSRIRYLDDFFQTK